MKIEFVPGAADEYSASDLKTGWFVSRTDQPNRFGIVTDNFTDEDGDSGITIYWLEGIFSINYYENDLAKFYRRRGKFTIEV